MTANQAKGHERKLGTMNTNSDPVQLYNFISGEPLPFEMSGAQVDQSLGYITQSAAENIEAISGMYAASLAKNPGLQSGIALDKQINQGNTGNVSFFADMNVGITYLCKVLIDTIPRVYDTMRQVTILRPDGQREQIKINERVPDRQTGEVVELNNLSQGSYDVVCEMGAMFKNSMEKGNAALLEVGSVAPEAFADNLDIFIRNIDAPNMDDS